VGRIEGDVLNEIPDHIATLAGCIRGPVAVLHFRGKFGVSTHPHRRR
jgi:hypothetical protein